MANEVHSPAEGSLTGLLGGIISDLGDLIRQEIRFAKAEVKSDLGKTQEAITILGIGVGIASVSGLLLSWMLVHLLHWLTIPAGLTADAAKLPLWACYGIVGGLFAAVGVFTVLAGKKKLESNNPLPDQTVQSLKENVQWIANSK